MVEMPGGEAVVKALSSQNVQLVFGLPGSHILSIFDALRDCGSIRIVTAKHEEGAAVMADVYGRLVGEPGVCLVTAGPGATNSITGVAQAYNMASPLLHISGTVPADSRFEDIHGLDDPDFVCKIFQPVTKWSARVPSVSEIPKTMSRAFRVCKAGRKGPVHIDLPRNILEDVGEVEFLYKKEDSKVGLSEEAVREACDMLISAKRPVIYAGRGVLRDFASTKVIELSKLLGAPVIVSLRSLDSIPHTHPLYIGFYSPRYSHPAALFALQDADILLAVGVRLGTLEATPLKEDHRKEWIHLDVEQYESTAEYNTKLRIVAGIRSTLERLIDILERRGARKREDRFHARIQELKAKFERTVEENLGREFDRKPIHPGVASRELMKVLQGDSILASDVGGHRHWLREVLKIRRPNSLLEPGSWGAMGFALPAAIAAKIVHPDRQVVAVTGDGGLIMSYTELPTMMENKTNITIVVYNDYRWGAIWQLQQMRYGRSANTEICSPNFAELARSFGAEGIRVEEASELPSAYEEALNSQRPTVVEVITDYLPIAPYVRRFFEQ